MRRVFLEVFLNQRVSAYRFHESLNLGLTKKYSYADYLTWQFKEWVELIKGFIFKMSLAPLSGHQVVSIALSALVWSHFRKDKCKVFEAPFDVRLSRNKKSDEASITVVQPDLCVICRQDRQKRLQWGFRLGCRNIISR